MTQVLFQGTSQGILQAVLKEQKGPKKLHTLLGVSLCLDGWREVQVKEKRINVSFSPPLPSSCKCSLHRSLLDFPHESHNPSPRFQSSTLGSSFRQMPTLITQKHKFDMTLVTLKVSQKVDVPLMVKTKGLTMTVRDVHLVYFFYHFPYSFHSHRFPDILWSHCALALGSCLLLLSWLG